MATTRTDRWRLLIFTLVTIQQLTAAVVAIAIANHQHHNNNNNNKIIPPIPPLSVPVWSLACQSIPSTSSSTIPITTTTTTIEEPNQQQLHRPSHSMNIVTFCTGLSVASPKLYAVSLYYNTLTKDSFLYHGRGILQLLRPCHKRLVPILGQQSGYRTTSTTMLSKPEQCARLGYPWHAYADDRLLADCALYLVLQLVDTVPAGDHLLTICQVTDTLVWRADEQRIVVSSQQQQQQQPSNSNLSDNTIVSAAAATTAATAPILLLDPSNTLYTGQLREEGIL
jgi:Flavin reductase like domain